MIWGSGGLKSRLAKAAGAETSGEMRDEKLHAVVARSRISKWKGAKHLRIGPLLEVEMSEKCTALWREAHLEVNMLEAHQSRSTFGNSNAQKVHGVVARSTFRSQNVKNTRGSDHFWRFRCRFPSIHYTTGNYTTLHSSTLHYTTLHYTTLHYTTLHYTTPHTTTTTTTQLHNYTPLQ